ncbi:hypothetical protein GGX14DRAFT_676493 [Mycena pura]|uniref:Iminophenyl-pyruvate dimer synthase domain-containing protein n=1 Tax=Mycena pura TaxID=153505 RepID=A0AAD6YJ40_9AGAR|nr:hypothetical protein GGX14DRAFT_676493 [Mycena pura]
MPPRIQNAGGSIVVKDLKTSLEALDVIVEEGEGRDDSEFAGDERAHYFVFKDLMEGKLGLRQIYHVPRTLDAAYCYLLLTIEKLWTMSEEEERRKLLFVTQPLNDGTDRAGQGTPFKQLRAEMKATMLSYVQVAAETDDQVVVDHDFGNQIQALLPIQTALDNMMDIYAYEPLTGRITGKGLNVAHTQGFKLQAQSKVHGMEWNETK